MAGTAELLVTIESTPVDRGVLLWWLGGSSWVLKTRQALVYVDLFTGPAPTETLTPLTKAFEDLLDPAQIRRADLVLSTHKHIDHCHRESLQPIYEHTEAIFAGARSSAQLFAGWGFAPERIVSLAPGERHQQAGLDILAVPSQDCDDEQAIGFLIQTEGVTLLDAGDSLYFDGFADLGRALSIDVALLNYFTNPPGSDFVQTMTPGQVAQAALDLRAAVVIPKHWDIWKELRANPQDVARALRGSHVRTLIPQPGAAYAFPDWLERV
jgi:L-ascorbate 6-phosphate lactonase